MSRRPRSDRLYRVSRGHIRRLGVTTMAIGVNAASSARNPWRSSRSRRDDHAIRRLRSALGEAWACIIGPVDMIPGPFVTALGRGSTYQHAGPVCRSSRCLDEERPNAST